MIKVYQKNEDYVCELWGNSTKHPDSIFHMLGDQKNENHYLLSDFIDIEYQVYQWLLWVASTLDWPFHAKELVEYANKEWYLWNRD